MEKGIKTYKYNSSNTKVSTCNLPRIQTIQPLISFSCHQCSKIVYLSDVVADLDPSGMIYPGRYQRVCVAKKNCTLTTERNKTALAVPQTE